MKTSNLLFLSALLLSVSAQTMRATVESAADLAQPITQIVRDRATGATYIAQGTATGGADANAKAKQISRVTYTRDAGKTTPEFIGLANTDLANKEISALAVAPGGALCTACKQQANDFRVAAMPDTAFEGAALLSGVLKDVAAADAKEPIAAIASDGHHILAAVNKQGEANFPHAAGGIAFVAVDGSGLAIEQLKYDGDAGAQAFHVDVTAGNDDGTKVRIAKTAAANGDKSPAVALAYDEHFDAYYLGIGQVQAGGGGQATALVMGKVEENDKTACGAKLIAHTAVNNPWGDADAWDIYSDNTSMVVANANKYVGATHVATVHGSTGKDLLVIAGGGGAADTDLQGVVHAFPLLPVGSTAGKPGTIGKYNNDTIVACDIDSLKEDPTNNVGQDPQLLKENKQAVITALFPVGDGIAASVAGARGDQDNNEAGVAFSRPVYDAYGNPRIWTPWQFIGGNRNKVAHFVVDERTGQIEYVSGEAGKDPKVTATQWSRGGDVRLNKTVAAGAALGDDFGILRLFTFDGATPAWTQAGETVAPGDRDKQPGFSLMVATGYGKVALIEAGTNADVGANKFIPTADFSGANVVKTYGDDAALKALGPIVAADVTRPHTAAGAAANNGYLLVGGEGGVAILRTVGTGEGWNTRPENVGTKTVAGLHAGLTFKQAKHGAENPFANTRKIMAIENSAYIMTDKAIYRLKLAAANLTDANIDNVTAHTITIFDKDHKATVDGKTVLDETGELYDMMIVSNSTNNGALLIATSTGLWVSSMTAANSGTNVDVPALVWKRPFDKRGNDHAFICGPAYAFELVSANVGGMFAGNGMNAVWNGNVYVTALDAARTNLNVYRFNVEGGMVQAIREYYTEGDGPVTVDNSTDYFYQIGSVESLSAVSSIFSHAFGSQWQSALMATHGELGDAMPLEYALNEEAFRQAQKPYSAISLHADLSAGAQLTNLAHDTAGGGMYVFGQPGVRCLE